MNNFRYLMLVAGFVLLAGCDRSEWNLPKTKTADNVAPADAADQDRTKKNDFLKSSREELDRVKQDLEALKEKTKSASGMARENMASELERLKQQQQVLESRWSKFRDEEGNGWKDVEKSFHDAVESLKNAIRKAYTSDESKKAVWIVPEDRRSSGRLIVRHSPEV